MPQEIEIPTYAVLRHSIETLRYQDGELRWGRHCKSRTGTSPVVAAKNKIGTFRSNYDYEYDYEISSVYPVRMRDCVSMSRQLVLSAKFRRRPLANYEIFNKSRPPSTSSLQVQRRVKRLVFIAVFTSLK